MRLPAVVVVACAGALVAPMAAHAAGTVTVSGNQVVFSSAAGVENNLTMVATATSVAVSDSADTIDESDASCEGTGTNTVTCTLPSVAHVVATLGDMNDRIDSSGTVSVFVEAQEGNDELTVRNVAPAGANATQLLGGEGNDRITTGDGDEIATGGPGTDTIATGAGDDIGLGQGGDGDTVDMGPGDDRAGAAPDDGTGDSYSGGPGVDHIGTFGAPPADLVADLSAGTIGGTNVAPFTAAGFEDATFEHYTTVTARGTAGSNAIETFDGPDTVDPGAGSDSLTLLGGADRALVRDGFADFVRCGRGQDTAEVDQLDTTIGCESVEVAFVRPAAVPTGPPGCVLAAMRARVRRTVLVKRGLRGAVECEDPASLEVRLLGQAAPRRGVIGMARAGDVVLAERSLPLAEGRRTVRLRVIRRLRKAIPRRARLRLEVVAQDRFGNVQVLTKRLRVTSR